MTAVMTANFSAPDLAAHPPRSPRVRLGGFVILPRILDKGRAEIAETAGEYHYNCPLDRHWFEFAGIDAGAVVEATMHDKKVSAKRVRWILLEDYARPVIRDDISESAVLAALTEVLH